MATASGNPIARYGLLAFRILVALLFLAAALSKLAGAPMMVTEFGQVGLGQGFRYLVALIEVAGAVMLVVPRTRLYGAATLFVVCVGALFAQVLRIHGDVIHVFVLMAATGFLAWTARPGAAA